MDHERLYGGLEQLGLLYDSSAALFYGTAMEHHSAFLRETSWFQKLPLDLRRQYGFCIALNGMKFSLSAQSLQRPLDREGISAAVCFILAGCLLDSLLDEGSSADRLLAMEKLEWSYCTHYFVKFGGAKSTHPVDILYGEMASFLQKRKDTAPSAYEKLLEHLKLAALTESSGASVPLAVDRSVCFVVIGFELALYGEHTPQEWDTFYLIGDIFRLIDDLCDAEQDAQAGRVNSLVDGALDGWMEPALAALQRAFLRLEKMVSRPFYELIRYEVQNWTLTNAYLYQRTMGVLPCPIS